MKRLLQIILCVASYYTYGQATDVYSTNNVRLPENAEIKDNQLQNYFSDLDKSKIETGLLLDVAIDFADLKKYNGIPTDSSYTNVKIVNDVYNTLVASKLSPNRGSLKPPADFQQEWFKAQSKDILPVAGIYFRYNEFSEINNIFFKTLENQNINTTVSTSSLSVTPDYKIKDKYNANGIWQNPYEVANVFAMAPIANSHNKLDFSVVFPNSIFLSNYSNRIQKLEVKFSDNTAYELVNTEIPIAVHYPSIGEYIWTYKLTLHTGEVLYAKNKFQITGDLGKYRTDEEANLTGKSSSTYKKVELENFQYFIPFPPMVVNRPKLTLYIRYRDGYDEITKPFIVAEGFDTGHITAPRMEGGDNNIDTFLNGDNMIYQLRQYLTGNYDIIYVDWGVGTDYIQNNAQLLKKAIKWVNEHKVGNEKNVVLGQSMGGLVARYALKEMEDNGENHDTKLYISHDSPHLGANTPVGLQYMMRNVSKTFLRSPIVAGANYIFTPLFFGVPVSEVLTLSDTPASRQMLINYVDKNYSIDNSMHNAWQNELKSKGFPQQTRNVAISNGNECGTDQNLQDLLTMHHKSKGWFIDIIGALIGGVTLDPGQFILSVLPGKSRYHYDFVVKPMTGINQNKKLYSGKIVYKKKILWCIPATNTLLEGYKYQPQGLLPMDKYGGGKFELAKSALPIWIGNHIDVHQFSFIPTPSALDIYSGNQNLTEEDYQHSYSPNEDLDISSFENFVAEKVEQNHHHISFSDRNGQFIINQLSDDTALQNEKIASAYLCGNRIKIGGDAIICDDDNQHFYTTGFAPTIYWSIEQGNNLIDVNSPTNEPQISFTPKDGANGLVKLKAYLSGDGASNTATQKVWIGKPKVKTKLQGSNIVDVESLNNNVTLSDQGVNHFESIVWKRLDTGELQYGTSFYTAYIPESGIPLKVDILNLCGKISKNLVLIDTTTPSDCQNLEIARTTNDSNTYTIVENTFSPCLISNRVQFKQNSDYQIIVFNVMGNTVISKTGKTFSLERFPTGSYFVKVMKNNKMVASQTLLKK